MRDSLLKGIIVTLLFSNTLLNLLACSDTTEIIEIPDKDQPTPPIIENYRCNRILIKHGLQIQCWLATDNFEKADGQPAYVMNPSDWALTGFTAPTFFGPPLINPSFFQHFPESQWSMAKAPYGKHLKVGPTQQEKDLGFLQEEHRKHLDKLITICFGDEEHYSDEVLTYLKDWYKVTRKHYPDVLVHNNQYPGQWSKETMKNYVKVAKPDLVTYDWYYFRSNKPESYRGSKDMATHLMLYRDIALNGTRGNHENYIAFGQYIQGFVDDETHHVITESQLRLYYYMTLTLGGKWLNWFRYLQGNSHDGVTTPTESSLLLEHGMPGKPAIHMKWANQCNKECMYLSDYLVRLKTKDVFFVPGTSSLTDGKPNGVRLYSGNNMSIKEIKGYVLKEGKPTEDSGDLYLGTFDIIPTEEQGDPSFFKDSSAKFFMLTNALTSKSIATADPLTQLVTISVDESIMGNKSLYWINISTGKKEKLVPIKEKDGTQIFEFTLNGGSGTLFSIEGL